MTSCLVPVVACAALLLPQFASGLTQMQISRREPKDQLQTAAVPLWRAAAARAVNELKAILGENRSIAIQFDENTNTVFIRASEAKVREAKEILLQLDLRANLVRYFYEYRLKYVDAIKTANRVKSILGEACCNNVRPTADGHAILVSGGTEEQMQQVQQLLQRLDVEQRARPR
jgi:type II secretory pathway component GspD/PulD (secretin)